MSLYGISVSVSMKDAATAEPRAAEYASIAAANPPRSGRSAIMAFSAPYRLIPSILRASTEIRAISVPIAAEEANESSAAVPAAIAITATKDVDGNGVSDMLQTEANPYDKTRNKMDKYMHNAYVLTELIDTIL